MLSTGAMLKKRREHIHHVNTRPTPTQGPLVTPPPLGALPLTGPSLPIAEADLDRAARESVLKFKILTEARPWGYRSNALESEPRVRRVQGALPARALRRF